MRHVPTILLILALPAGAIGFAVGAQAVEALQLPGDIGNILQLFLPLFVAGLFMVPFIAPFLDRKAKEALAAAPSRREGGGGAGDDEEPRG